MGTRRKAWSDGLLGMSPAVAQAVLLLVFLSLAAWVLGTSVPSPEYGIGVDFKTYWQKINWWPYPFFFLVAGPVVEVSWRSFRHAWLDMARTETFCANDGRSEEVLALHVHRLERLRRWLFAGALIAAAVIVWIDDRETYEKHSASTFSDQMMLACESPDFGSAWLFRAWQDDAPEYSPCVRRKSSMSEEAYERFQLQHLESGPVGTAVSAENTSVSADLGMIALAVVMSLQMLGIATLGFAMLFQACFHIASFGLFNYSKFAAQYEARIRLNPTSPIGEFGLEEWNQAWNTFYWLLLPATLIVLASAVAQPEEQPDGFADNLLRVAVGIALVGPIVGTILARQPLLREAWREEVPDFRNQRLWPLDANWSSKLGMVLAFGLGSYLIGIEVGVLVGQR